MATLILLSVMAGGETGVFSGLLVLLVVTGLFWATWGWIDRRRPAAPSGWAQAAPISFRPAAGHSAASPGGVAMALSRVEVRELASSAAVGVAVGFCGLIVYMFGYEWAADYSGGLIGSFDLYPIYVHPLAGLVVLAAHRARTRATRDGTQEVFDACPTTHATRTVGHLLTAWMPAVLALVFLAVQTVAFSQAVTVVHGEVGAQQLAAVVGAAALCIGATCLGVALARWAPWTLVPVAAVIGIGFATTALATAGDRLSEPLRQLSTWLNDPSSTNLFVAPHWLAHHVWILALVGLVAVLALVRDQPRPGVFAAGAVLVVAASGSAVAATRPIDASDAQRIAAMINDPETHQRCIDVSGLPLCTFPTDIALAEHFADVVAPVAAAAPPGTLDGWAVRHRVDVDLEVDDLDPEVRRLLAEPDDRQLIPMKMIGHHLAEEGARFWVALTAVGITHDTREGSKLSVSGQARGVIAFWLATRGVDADTAANMTSFHADAPDSTRSYDRPWPDSCFAGPAPVVWEVADVDAGRLLVGAPEAEVAEVVFARWDHFTDRKTTTEELLAALGLTQDNPRAGFTRGAGEC